MVLTRVNPLTCDGWNDWIEAEDTYSLFHCSEWAHVLTESYDYRPHYLVARRNDRFSALLPFMEVDSLLTGRRGVSLPFSDHCDPVIGTDIKPSDVLSAATEYAERRGWRYLDVHGGHHALQGVPPFSAYVGHRLDLSGAPARRSSRLRETTRRNIRKATRLGVEVDIGSTPEALRQFHRLHCLTRKRHRLPAQPFRFFQSIHDRLLSKQLGHVVRAVHNGQTVGAAMFLHFGDQALFKFGASDFRYQHLRMNDLILWEAIEWAADHGYKTLFFGRTDRANTGLRHFKSGWGSDEYPITYYKYDVKRRVWVTNTPGGLNAMMKPAFRVLPIPMSRMIGAMLYRHFG